MESSKSFTCLQCNSRRSTSDEACGGEHEVKGFTHASRNRARTQGAKFARIAEERVRASEETVDQGSWLPIVEYATRTGVSISTVRRRIRSNQIVYRLQGGKYLVKYGAEDFAKGLREIGISSVEELKEEVEQLHEENAELRMLVEVLTRNTLLAS